MQVKRTFSGASWESKVGYCRGVKVGNLIYLSGTAAVDEAGSVFACGDAYKASKTLF